MIVGVTLVDHLVGTHYMLANQGTIASRQALSPNHPLRRFLKPFTYYTIGVNKVASRTLNEPGGMLHRSVGLDVDGLNTAFDIGSQTIQYKPYRQFLEDNGNVGSFVNYPFGEDFLAYGKIIEKYVMSWMALYYPDDDSILNDPELIDFWRALRLRPDSRTSYGELTGIQSLLDYLSTFLIFVTGIHSHVGTVGDYIMDPKLLSSKLEDRKTEASLQAGIQAMNIGLSTAYRQIPLLKLNPTHLWLKDSHYEGQMEAWDNMRQELFQLEQTITKRNEKRRFPCRSFLPSLQGISVAV